MAGNRRARMAGASMVALVVGAVLWGIARPAQAPRATQALAAIEPEGCPYVDGRRSLVHEEEQRAQAVEPRGGVRAKHKHVLGLTLGKANRAALDVWAATRGMTCLSHRDSQNIECTAGAPAEVANHFADAEALTVVAAFNDKQRLKQIRFEANFPDVNKAAEAMRLVWRDAEGQSGTPAHVAGEPEGHFLAVRIWQEANAEFTNSDLYSKVSATNVGSHVAWVHHVEDLATDET